MGDVTVWGIHAGRYAEADSQFKRDDLVAVGWSRIGDLSQLPADREAFKSAVQAAYPATKAGAVPVYGGLLYRFVHEVKEGDLFVFPSKVDREVHIGEVVGGYRYLPARRLAHACDSSTERSPRGESWRRPGAHRSSTTTGVRLRGERGDVAVPNRCRCRRDCLVCDPVRPRQAPVKPTGVR